MGRIIYKCKNCGSEKSLTQDWEDLKPKFCTNKKCKTSFRLNPEALEIIKPESKTEEKKYGNSKNNKRKEFSKTE